MRDPRKQADRLATIRLRYTINSHLEDQRITAPSDIARAVGMPAAEAVRLLTRRQWREGDVAALQAIAERLGLEVPLEGLDLSAEERSPALAQSKPGRKGPPSRMGGPRARASGR